MLTSFLGRESETVILRQLLSQEVRLITITGPGGVGKTSLALHVARSMQDSFVDGVFFIYLAAISDPTLIIPTIAHALNLSEWRSKLLFDSLKDYLHDRQVLLLLDNFEQIISAAPLLTELLSACPHLQILVTSRESLRVRGEQELQLSPLALPDKPVVEELLHYPGVALFVERAQAVQLEFRLTPENAEAVAEVCSHLDGLPLAIELAAARIKLLPPQALLARLRDSPLQLLANGARDLPARQRTLRNAIQWSYDLLDPEEKRVFCWLSVFPSTTSLKAAQAVIGPPASVEILDSLVNKNLLRSVDTRGGARLMMLETVREFGWEQLAQSGELEDARRALADYFLSFAEGAESELTGADQKSWLQRLDQERDNLRAALQWAIDRQEGELAQRIAYPLLSYWFRRGYWSEGRRWFETALSSDAVKPVDQAVRAKTLYGAGVLARFQGDFARARMLCDQSLTLFRTLTDQTGILKTLVQLCRITSFQMDQESLSVFYTEATTLIETLPDSVAKGEAYTDLALSMLDFGAPRFHPVDVRYLAESERIHRKFHNQSGLALASLHQGIRGLFDGDYILARSRFEEAERLANELGDIRLLNRMAGGQALLDLAQGDFSAARFRLETCIQQHDIMGDYQLQSNIMMLVVVLHNQGLDLWAARVWGMAEVLPGNHLNQPALEAYQARFHLGDILADLRSQLGEEAFAREYAAGRQLRLADLKNIPHPDTAIHVVPTHSPLTSLTAREQEVLQLLAQNLSNHQIAEQLVVSRRTVDAHLRSIYDKLDVKTRDGAIRVAGEQGLLNR